LKMLMSDFQLKCATQQKLNKAMQFGT